ncbi:peptide chain release factor N(5)-glutamine methyltransferase [Dongia sp.]|uniref:peptide chain release factor N(5)-glutamine methyltransferase n=1 Tax=Dongia sp. TaxID=1977262 RepID=UPI0035AEFE3E
MTQRIADLLSEGMKALKAAGVEAPAREARLLLGVAAQVTPTIMIGFPERTVGAEAAEAYLALIARRVAREPISHLMGVREFWSRPFLVTRDVLDPRPDSEALIAAVLDEIYDKRQPLRLLDFGVGSGCLLLTLLAELPQAGGWGVDLSAAALTVAARNAAALGLAGRVNWRRGSWDSALQPGDPAAFDIIVSNPPYIRSGDIAGLEPEVARHEPHLALDGGADGLDAYRQLAPAIARCLAAGGLAALEIGQGQGESVRALMTQAGLADAGSAFDLGERERCLLFRKA